MKKRSESLRFFSLLFAVGMLPAIVGIKASGASFIDPFVIAYVIMYACFVGLLTSIVALGSLKS